MNRPAIKASTASEVERVAALRQQCEKDSETTQKLAAKADVTDQRVKDYETRLTDFEKDATDLLKRIRAILPEATSAGLAGAFGDQKGRFKRPQWIWFSAFLVSLILFLILGLALFLEFFFGAQVKKWDEILGYLMLRLPIVIPLVWMAITAGRHYELALKMEEEYAFKEAVSRAFEGYKREMTRIEAKGASDIPLTVLCNNLLKVILANPGRLYENPAQDVTPMNEVVEAGKPTSSPS